MAESGPQSACLICLKSVLQVKTEDGGQGHGCSQNNLAWFVNFCKRRLRMRLPPGLLNSSQTTTDECGIDGSSGDDYRKQHYHAFNSLFCEDCEVLVTSLSKICAELDTLEAKLLAKLDEMGRLIGNSKKLVSCNELLGKLSLLLNFEDVEVLDQFRVDLKKKCKEKARKLFPDVVLIPGVPLPGVNLNLLESPLATSPFKYHSRNSMDDEIVSESFDETAIDDQFDSLVDIDYNMELGVPVLCKIEEEDILQTVRKPKKQLNRKPQKLIKSSKTTKNLAQRPSQRGKSNSNCKLCNLKFRSDHALRDHKKKSGHRIIKGQHMKELVKITGRLEKCSECSNEFTNPLELYEHQVNNHKGGPDKLNFKCSSCPKIQYQNCKYLLSHLICIHEKNSAETENVTTPLFYCALCPSSFRTSQTFKLHNRFVHWNQPIYFCDDDGCLQGFKSPEEQYSHMTGPVHEYNEVFQCDLCHMGYFSSDRLSLHKFVHADTIKVRHGKRFTCPVESCSKDSPRWDVIMAHHNHQHADLDPIPTPRCELCAESNISVPELESHIRWKHSEKDIPFENISCEACENGETYPTLREYIVHSLTDDHAKFADEKRRKWREGDESEDDFEAVEEQNVKVCPYPNCGRKFISQEKFARHKDRKHQRGPVVRCDPKICEDCGKSFDKPSRLTQHKSEVHSAPRHECSECGRKFATRWSLKTHVSAAHAERTLPCETCGKMFATTEMLKKHMAHHDRRYKCHLCPAAFGSTGQFKAHLRKHAGIRLCCEWCTLSFLDRSTLLRHFKKVHRDKYKEYIDSNPRGWYRGGKRISAEDYVAAGGTIKKTKATVEYLDSYASNQR